MDVIISVNTAEEGDLSVLRKQNVIPTLVTAFFQQERHKLIEAGYTQEERDGNEIKEARISAQ